MENTMKGFKKEYKRSLFWMPCVGISNVYPAWKVHSYIQYYDEQKAYYYKWALLFFVLFKNTASALYIFIFFNDHILFFYHSN